MLVQYFLLKTTSSVSDSGYWNRNTDWPESDGLLLFLTRQNCDQEQLKATPAVTVRARQLSCLPPVSRFILEFVRIAKKVDCEEFKNTFTDPVRCDWEKKSRSYNIN